MDTGQRAFHRQLQRELPKWVEEGIVDEAAATLLAERYGASKPGLSLAMLGIYALGGLLIGGGVISLVAYNWSAIPDGVKLLLALALMTAAHAGGYVWWKAKGTHPGLGHALVLFGTLMLGANIGLAAQVFHVSSNGYNGVGAWALGALVVTWIYRSGPVAALTVLLGGIYGVGVIERFKDWPPFPALVLAAVFFPLAWLIRSRALFVWVLVISVITHAAVLGVQGGDEAVLLFFLLVSALVLAWGLAAPGGVAARFVPPARLLALACLGVLAYALSFHDLADELRRSRFDAAAALAVGPFALAAAATLAWALKRRRAQVLESPASLAGVSGAFVICVATLIEPQEISVAVGANLTLVALSGAALMISVRSLERAPFWTGTLLGGLIIVSRFFEFETELWLKGLAFIACGGAAITLGVLFERRLREQAGERA